MQGEGRAADGIAVAGIGDDGDEIVNLGRIQKQCAVGQSGVRTEIQDVAGSVGLELEYRSVCGVSESSRERQSVGFV